MSGHTAEVARRRVADVKGSELQQTDAGRRLGERVARVARLTKTGRREE